MTVTDIEEISKAKSKIYIDGEVAFALYRQEIRNLQIVKGSELPDEVFHHIMDELLVKRAKLRCMNLLKSRDYTRHQLEVKLRQGFYPETVIAAAIDYVEEYGYVDDLRYASSYIGYAGASKSKKQIENELLKRGVSSCDIAEAYAAYSAENISACEEELIEKFLTKKHYDRNAATVDERRKIIAFLYRKGFSLDKIYKAIGLNG